MAPVPVTIITGFLGSGKTTLILNLIPQLPKTYKLALLKNEFGDVAVDSQLASSASISGVRELLNGCICCNLVGQLSEALFQLRDQVRPDRIIIETSGSAFPATLAMEVNRVARENVGSFTLDGVVSVIDVENWKGYDDTSITAKMQAKFTDLIVFNKWELVDEIAFDRCRDRVGDLDVSVAWVKSRKGYVDLDVVLGIDGAMVSKEGVMEAVGRRESLIGDDSTHVHDHDHDHGHSHAVQNHQDEVEVLSVILKSTDTDVGVDLENFEELLLSAPKDEIYRIKGLITSKTPPADSTGEETPSTASGLAIYVLNWAFGRWTYTPLTTSHDLTIMEGASCRLTFILARGESNKWKRKLQTGGLITFTGGMKGDLMIDKIG